ncbi:alpha-tubulin suppressor-like RCC1 family protein [Actinomadura pelletieri DSM 43383]|uniref:Alpha-tubulin suppressor-like RCC1 family protein n=1 Tax=Actinomadura pelletieri DSM 43383 TaxID=1120940 RepID=A0A495QIS6_9ACTN|nr:chromosome condensation regulator RCC1 [Actinomadura pelletieri]RKS72075.1 alpha-tubulin suppressor-like RCC1 family protein [Actinomadura pelletieri DSM 43383]
MIRLGRPFVLGVLLLTAAGCGGSASPAVAPPSSTPPAAGSDSGRTGTVLTSGLNENGQLGRPGASIETGLAPVGGLGEVRAVAGGARHSLAIAADGTVVAWGANDQGQLGDGTNRDSRVPVPVLAPDGGPGRLTGVVAVSANNDFSMALRRDGTVVTWGDGSSGQRGIGERTSPRFPTTVKSPDGRRALRDVAAIAADGHTELVLRRNGQVLAWGANDYGMVGDGTREDRSLPVPVRGLDGAGRLKDVVRIAIGGQYGLALLRDGRVVSWGHNDLGQLGDGTRNGRLTPAPVRGVGGNGVLDRVISVAAAEKHGYAVRADGTVVAWGNNTAGQLGDGTLKLRETPVEVVGRGDEKRLRGVAQVFAGEAYGAAVLTNGTTLTWGAGGSGQLGSGKRAPRSRPGEVVTTQGGAPGTALTVGVGERHLILLARP